MKGPTVWSSRYGFVDLHELMAHKSSSTEPSFALNFTEYTGPTEVRDLCSRCRSIDFGSIFDLGTSLQSACGASVASLKPATQDVSESSCSMCLLFAAVQQRELESQQCHLRAFPGIEGGQGDRELKPCGVTLSIVEGPEIQEYYSMAIKKVRFEGSPIILPVFQSPNDQGSSVLSGRLVRQEINYPLIRSWLSDCAAAHTECTEQTNRPFANNIKVIDCRSSKIVPWNGKDRYLTLSYVWGTSGQLNVDAGSFPKLISDAIVFTLNIGINYLWVDKYCIDQQDPADVSCQVAQMDDIYENAAATIIASSCSSSSEGLPGVSTVPRENQPWSMSSDGTLLVSSMVPISTVLADSLWLTRGWTYQEGLLSRRCLVFTKQQIYFICRTMSTSESVKHSMVPLGDDQTIRSTSVVIEADLFQRHEKGRERSDGDGNKFNAQMEAFSKRNLTFEEDVLNAFRGVLNRQPWRSFWGIPLPTRNWWVAKGDKASALAIDDSSVDAENSNNLSPNAAFAGGLAWHKRSSGSERRRKGGFPTWCWASTLGEVIWRQNELGVESPRRVLDYARFQIDEGSRQLSLSDFIASHPDAFVLPQTTHRLLVTGHIVQFRLFQIQGGQFIAQDIGSKFNLTQRLWSVPFNFDVDSEIPELKGDYERPFPALILLVDEWSARSFEHRRREAEYDDKDDEYDENTGRTFLLLLNWDGEVAQRRALIEIESGLLVGATKEEKTFELS